MAEKKKPVKAPAKKKTQATPKGKNYVPPYPTELPWSAKHPPKSEKGMGRGEF